MVSYSTMQEKLVGFVIRSNREVPKSRKCNRIISVNLITHCEYNSENESFSRVLLRYELLGKKMCDSCTCLG